jgi:hypothetical protein
LLNFEAVKQSSDRKLADPVGATTGSSFRILVLKGRLRVEPLVREQEVVSPIFMFGSLRVMEPGLLQLRNGAGHAGRQHDALDQMIS